MRPTVSTRRIGPGQIEIRTVCHHGAYRIGYRLGDGLDERAAAAAAIFHHAVMKACSCLVAHWRRYRTDRCPEDLDVMRRRFEAVWSDVTAQQRRRGYTLIDGPAAVRSLVGEQVA